MYPVTMSIAVLLAVSSGRAEQIVPPVQVGSIVVVGREAQEMIDELAHTRHRHYHHGGAALDWLASPVQPTPAPGIPAVYVNGVFVTGYEAEEMINRLSRMRTRHRWHAGESLEWLGMSGPIVAPTAVVTSPPAAVIAPAPVVAAPAPAVAAPAPAVAAPAPAVSAPAPAVAAPAPAVAAPAPAVAAPAPAVPAPAPILAAPAAPSAPVMTDPGGTFLE